ncbi:MAG: phosphatidate cytidylyltransferase [Coriobacteriia bacterium]|nr:phosphatidate cytidylyltransferase [Coriobacteriia bacterium]
MMHESNPAGIEPTTFLRRTITGGIYGVVVLAAILIGNNYFALPLLCSAFGIIGTHEFYNLTAPKMNKFARTVGSILAVALPIVTYISLAFVPENPVIGTGGLAGLIGLFYAVAVALLFYICWVALTPTSHAKDAALSFFGAIYLGVPLSFLILIRNMEQGVYLAPMVVISVWAFDSFAYIGGSLFGRHKLAPIISPKKSWEGFVAGLAGAVIIWEILPLITKNKYSFSAALLVGAITSFASLVGDLFESRIKREAKQKDSGTLLPGHGGLLDRLDSTLAVSLVMFLLLSTAGVLLGVVTL